MYLYPRFMNLRLRFYLIKEILKRCNTYLCSGFTSGFRFSSHCSLQLLWQANIFPVGNRLHSNFSHDTEYAVWAGEVITAPSVTIQNIQDGREKRGLRLEVNLPFKILDHCAVYVAILDVGQSRQKLQQMYGKFFNYRTL